MCECIRIFKYVSLNMENVWCSPDSVPWVRVCIFESTDDSVRVSPGLSETCHGGVSNGPVMILVKDRFWSTVAKPRMSSPGTFWLTFSSCVLCPPIGRLRVLIGQSFSRLSTAAVSVDYFLWHEMLRMSLQQKLVSLSQECEADRRLSLEQGEVSPCPLIGW